MIETLVNHGGAATVLSQKLKCVHFVINEYQTDPER